MVQGGGAATRMTSSGFIRNYGRSAPLQRALLRYTPALMAQVTQTAACNRFHVVEQRLARWLLAWALEPRASGHARPVSGIDRVGNQVESF